MAQREVISIKGLEQLVKLKQAGKPLPSNYASTVKFYLAFKAREVARLRAEYERATQQLKFAQNAARLLGVEV